MPLTYWLGVDTGGTFTDFVLLGDGEPRIHKVLSTPSSPERAILQGIRDPEVIQSKEDHMNQQLIMKLDQQLNFYNNLCYGRNYNNRKFFKEWFDTETIMAFIFP